MPLNGGITRQLQNVIQIQWIIFFFLLKRSVFTHTERKVPALLIPDSNPFDLDRLINFINLWYIYILYILFFFIAHLFFEAASLISNKQQYNCMGMTLNAIENIKGKRFNRQKPAHTNGQIENRNLCTSTRHIQKIVHHH